MQTGIAIGASPEAVKEMRQAIMDILNARVDNKTMQIALETLSKGASVNNVSISGCSVTEVSGRRGQAEP